MTLPYDASEDYFNGGGESTSSKNLALDSRSSQPLSPLRHHSSWIWSGVAATDSPAGTQEAHKDSGAEASIEHCPMDDSSGCHDAMLGRTARNAKDYL